MKQSSIRQTAQTARALAAERHYGTPEAFLLAWVAWESLKFRVLAVGLVRQGWRMEAVKEFFDKSSLYTKKDYNKVFGQVFGKHPEQHAGEVGHIWRECEAARRVRHRFVHGMGSSRPQTLSSSTERLLLAVENVEWLKPLMVRRHDGSKAPVGDVLAPARVVGVPPRSSVRQLFAEFDMKPRKNPWEN
jgi:hypothetical protein